MEDKSKSKSRNEAQEEIEYYIEVNELKPHDRLPSERELSEIFNLNRSTLRGAIQKLIEEGKIYKEAGVGNYVAEPKMVRNLNMMDSLTKFVESHQKTIKSKVLSANIIECNKQITKNLKIPLGTEVFQLTRLRYVDNVPVSIETSFLNYEKFPGIEAKDFEIQSLYHVMENEYGAEIIKGKEKLGLTFATSDEAQRLEIEIEEPIFFISGVTTDNEDNPVEYFRSVVRPDKIKFSSVLKKEQDKIVEGEN